MSQMIRGKPKFAFIRIHVIRSNHMHRVLYGRYFREWDIRKTKSVRAMTRNILKKAQQTNAHRSF